MCDGCVNCFEVKEEGGVGLVECKPLGVPSALVLRGFHNFTDFRETDIPFLVKAIHIEGRPKEALWPFRFDPNIIECCTGKKTHAKDKSQ